MKLIDRALLFFYTIVALLAPLDAALLLPPQLFPEFLLPIEPWLARKYGSYLAGQKPGFFLALVWLEVVFQWPLAILNLYGIWGRRSWVRTTCLVHGVSYATAMIAVSTELMETSHRASDKLLVAYFLFIAFGILAILRGIVPTFGSSSRFTTTELGAKKIK